MIAVLEGYPLHFDDVCVSDPNMSAAAGKYPIRIFRC